MKLVSNSAEKYPLLRQSQCSMEFQIFLYFPGYLFYLTVCMHFRLSIVTDQGVSISVCNFCISFLSYSIIYF